MSKPLLTVYLAYQDCALCGDKGAEVLALAQKNKIQIEKLPFFTKAGAELIKAATKAGYPSLPVFFDGANFAYTLEDLLAKQEIKSAPKVEKKKKEKKRVAKK